MNGQYVLTAVRTGADTRSALLFATKTDLVRFKLFCQVYQASGCTEGVLDYRLESGCEEVSASEEVCAHYKPLDRLDQSRLECMAQAIRRGQGCNEEQLFVLGAVPVLTGMVDGAIGFLYHA